MPFIAENINNPEKIRAYLYNKRPKIFLLGTVVIVFIFVGAPYIFRLVYGAAYQESVTVLRILLIAVVLVLYNLFYTPVLNALKKYRVYQIINIAQVVIKVLLNVILIPRFGLGGAAVGTVFSYFFRLVAIELYFRLRLRGILKI
jgi:O-antigen/teichoic acid export membrane protein